MLKRERKRQPNEPMERLDWRGQNIVKEGAGYFEELAGSTELHKEPERLALHRAMARFLIDSGIASARGYV